ncbi:diaminopimelate decarboxylase [Clostridium sp. BJN0001]|uniref:diaminopimelate decarboxylase n=1 Tax=Clostridium sp. BJN0001 TaxID=2930219 RepID=UPI001FD1C58C|nr:diaminopimelate decarboxylase [Clostridium sp. BJN0001]
MKLFGTMKINGNKLEIGGVKAEELVKEYKTPLYVYDTKLIKEYCRDYRKYFKCEENGNRVAFAGKAFLNLEMCRILSKENMSLDVVSGGELYTAYKADFPLKRVIFHGNNKTKEEIDMGIELGVGVFVVDNMDELNAINEAAKKKNMIQDIFLRLTPGIEAHTHEYIKTGQIDSKFGFAPVDNIIFDAVKKAIDLKNVNLLGIHCHIGSQIFELKPYQDAVDIMLGYVRKIEEKFNYKVKNIDFGGGFGVYYTDSDKPKATSEYCETIINRVDEVCRKYDQKRPNLIIEPGRSIVANAGTTLYTIGAVKNIPGIRKYVSVDGGMTDNIRPSLYQAEYECALASNVQSESLETVTIAGKCCESGDLLIHDVKTPEVKIGDILAIATTGAYGYSMANNYNKTPKAAVIMVEDGKSKLVCKRETYENLIINEI